MEINTIKRKPFGAKLYKHSMLSFYFVFRFTIREYPATNWPTVVSMEIVASNLLSLFVICLAFILHLRYLFFLNYFSTVCTTVTCIIQFYIYYRKFMQHWVLHLIVQCIWKIWYQNSWPGD